MANKSENFRQIVSEFSDKIFRLCSAYTQNDEDRKDLFQDVLVRIWRGVDTFAHRSSTSTWIYRITVNTSIDFLRRELSEKNSKPHIYLDEEQPAEKPGDPEKNFLESERIELLYRSINRLSFLDATIITLFLEDMSYREISKIVGISEKNVGVKLTRIRKVLKSLMKEELA